MLYSALVGVFTYYAILFVIGVLVNAMALKGNFITLAVIGFMVAYLVRTYSRFVYRMVMGVAIFATTILVVIWGILPMLAGTTNTWLIILSSIVGFVVYVSTRRRIFRFPYRRLADGTMVPPIFGHEWCRRICIIVM